MGAAAPTRNRKSGGRACREEGREAGAPQTEGRVGPERSQEKERRGHGSGKAQGPKQPWREGQEGPRQGKERPLGLCMLGSSKKKEVQYSPGRKYHSSLLLHVPPPQSLPPPPPHTHTQLWSRTEIQEGCVFTTCHTLGTEIWADLKLPAREG